MNKKGRLIHALENELKGGESNMKHFDCTVVEAEEILKNIELGYYDQIIRTTQKIYLYEFITYVLNRKKTTIFEEPSLKEYKIHCIKERLNRELAYLSFDKSVEKQQKYKEKMTRLLNKLKAGEYDELLTGEEYYWFGDPVDVKVLLEWDELREKTPIKNQVTFPNYTVFSIYYRLMDHVRRVNTWKSLFGRYYECRYDKHKQTPTTPEELQSYEALATKLVTKNYDWREARTVVREFSKLDIFNDYKFPHDIKEIMTCFKQNKDIIFKDYENRGTCCCDLEAIQEGARNLLEVLNENNLVNIYLNKSKDKVDEYLRKMITSQFDIEILYKESSPVISKQKIKNVLENPRAFSDSEIKNVFSSFPTNTKKTLCDLAIGVLYSLSAYQKGSHIKIYDDAVNMQKALNCWIGTVYYDNFTKVNLSNGDTIYSILYEEIESKYSAFQQEYDHYFKNSTSDLEYIEGCAEIIGNVVISQIFLDGNKRTAKCLFNAMLVSRGIVPPILDFCSEDLNLWEKFACNRSNNYKPAKRVILEESLKVSEHFDTNSKKHTTNNEYVKK